jgi:hypothetical protein
MSAYQSIIQRTVLIALFAIPVAGLVRGQDDGKQAIRQERVIAGGPKDFMEVRHVVLRGTNAEIGRALAAIAKERYQFALEETPDRFRNRVLRKYLEKNYPILHERMRGVASAFGKQVDDDRWDFTALGYLLGLPGCSVVHCPPGITVDGKSIVSRNYEYPTGTLINTRPKPGELPANARPYLIEMHPDRGYPSMALCTFDLLSGVIDGINSEGLTVAMLTDGEIAEKFGLDIPQEVSVGLDVQQVLRLLLDTCATVEEAKEALLTTKQHYSYLPNHFLIADRHGHAFVWELSHTRNREYIIENPGKPLVTTNLSLHRHLVDGKPPPADQMKDVCTRYCRLTEQLAARKEKLTTDIIKATHSVADAVEPQPKAGPPPTRTLWHALYFPEQRKIQVSFYLGEEPHMKEAGNVQIRRSDYIELTLQPRETGKK